jgi:glycosyltransferase involved in cell wall biosynthesis
VSVVLAVRDDPEGLTAAAASILGQRDADLELVVVDDGSAGPTRERLASLARRDARVRPLRVETSGLTQALAAGCRAAAAPVLARHDAGDRSDPDRLSRQLRLLRSADGLTLVSCWTRNVGPVGEALPLTTCGGAHTAPVRLDPTAEPGCESLGPSSHGSVVFRRDAYERAGGYRSEFRLAQDWDLWWRLAELGDFAAVPEPLYTRRLDPRSVSFRHGRAQRRLGRIALEAARARRRGEDEAFLLRRARHLSASVAHRRPGRREEARGLYFIGSLLRDAADPRASEYFRQAARCDPLSIRAWIRWAQSRA